MMSLGLVSLDTTTASLSESISTGTETFLGSTSKILDFITGNPLLVLLLVGGTVLPLGIWIFKKVKGAAR